MKVEIITAKLSNVSTNIILKVHQMNKVSHQRSLYSPVATVYDSYNNQVVVRSVLLFCGFILT